MELIEYFRGEWAVISQALSTFAVALLLASGGIWALLSALFKQEIANKNSTIEFLRERLQYGAATDPVVETQKPAIGASHTSIAEEAKVDHPQAVAPPPKDPDAIYQRGRIVGKVIAPRLYLFEGRATFEAITDTADLDRSKPFQYRDHTLMLVSIERAIGMKIVAGRNGSRTLQNVIEGVVCQIS